MATIYKKKYPVPMPEGAEIVIKKGKKFARWANGRNQVRTAEVLDDGRIQFVSDCWYVRYRDAEGIMRRESTGFRDKQAAQKYLADILADIEKIQTGIITHQEKQIASHADQPLSEHLTDYLKHLSYKRIRGRKVSLGYRKNIKGRLSRLFEECKYRRLRDITRNSIERWLDKAENDGLAAATRNEYLISLIAFCNWAVNEDRLTRNPVSGIGKADRASDRRRVRRALTVDEVARLLDAAKRRPIAEVGRRSIPLPNKEKCGRSSWTFEELTAENLERCYAAGLKRLNDNPRRRKKLEALGRERAMFYLLAVSTGLRWKELSSITIHQIHLDALPTPYLLLKPQDAKNAKGANIPLRTDVANELRDYLSHRGSHRHEIKLLPKPPNIRVFDADCQAAGIAKTDARGRVVDIHALRHTFGTHLSASGVHPRTAMAAMRHSRIELTMNFYTDPELLDVAGAVNALPDFGKAKSSHTQGA